MSKQIIITVALVLMALLSFSFGLISCGSTGKAQTQAQQPAAARPAPSPAQSAAAVVQRGFISNLLIPDITADRGLQKALGEKSKNVMTVWSVLKVANGTVNILQSAQAAGGETLSPINNIMGKLSNMLSFSFGLLLFWKVLLMISSYMVFLIVIPICAIIAIVLIWTYKDRKRVNKMVLSYVLIGIIAAFAIPAALHLSTLLEKKLLIYNVTTVTASIEAKGRTADTMERNVSAARRQGNSVANFIVNARNLGNDLSEDITNYFILFIFVYLITPVIVLLVIIFLARYFIKMILSR
ncbi:MAG: hypothetical protein FWD28_02210 [Treponema sp.]|nr:hypothetical protein [Treponema sp.]